MINYNNKIFASLSNTPNGDVNASTLFNYWQENDIIWATYKGDTIRFGTLVGTVARNGDLNFNYQHLDKKGNLRTGKCFSKAALLENGKIRLQESWQWTNGDRSKGTSIVEQIS